MAQARPIQIAHHEIGPAEPCYIIAEVGSNHNRDLSMAKEMIDVAAEAGCDAVKFQTFSADTLYSKKTPPFSYLGDINVFDLIRANELPRAWQAELFEYAEKRGITFLSTPFDRAAVDELDDIGVPAFKIASFELVDLPFLHYIAGKGKPMIVSTGLANLGEIEEAIGAIRSAGNQQIALLHCNSLYPTPAELVNLRAMRTMRMAFRTPVGFSDHTIGTTIPIAAVAMGANLIEKHFTLSRNLPGPDHGPFALEPDELHSLVRQIRSTEQALGDGIKQRSREEEEMAQKGRRSIVAATDIASGVRITRDMLRVKRPGTGIAPKFLEVVIGRTTRTQIFADDPITWDGIN
ncbi:MAG: pseudaminic acid synthase [Alicyclobacillus sp. RIFOXYA1_FULL_53_8]|nr:MAG: pseudaminic acid synthase [Alicyclobacillus sp. RIFOXYA1_FULL_53_8]